MQTIHPSFGETEECHSVGVNAGSFGGYKTADPLLYSLLKQFVKELRNRRPTESETIMWQCLRNNSLGFHFRRQHIVGCFIADFICLSKKLIIELDGGYHNLPQQIISDKERTKVLSEMGFNIIRFTNEEILFDTNNVLKAIKNYLSNE